MVFELDAIERTVVLETLKSLKEEEAPPFTKPLIAKLEKSLFLTDYSAEELHTIGKVLSALSYTFQASAKLLLRTLPSHDSTPSSLATQSKNLHVKLENIRDTLVDMGKELSK